MVIGSASSALEEPASSGLPGPLGRRVVVRGAAWLLLTCGVLCLLFAEIWLVAAAYYAFADFTNRWWLAISLVIPIVAMMVLTGFIAARSISALRQAQDAAFVKLSAISLALGVGEVTLAVCIFAITMVLLAGGPQHLPTVHVR